MAFVLTRRVGALAQCVADVAGSDGAATLAAQWSYYDAAADTVTVVGLVSRAPHSVQCRDQYAWVLAREGGAAAADAGREEADGTPITRPVAAVRASFVATDADVPSLPAAVRRGSAGVVFLSGSQVLVHGMGNTSEGGPGASDSGVRMDYYYIAEEEEKERGAPEWVRAADAVTLPRGTATEPLSELLLTYACQDTTSSDDGLTTPSLRLLYALAAFDHSSRNNSSSNSKGNEKQASGVVDVVVGEVHIRASAASAAGSLESTVAHIHTESGVLFREACGAKTAITPGDCEWLFAPNYGSGCDHSNSNDNAHQANHTVLAGTLVAVVPRPSEGSNTTGSSSSVGGATQWRTSKAVCCETFSTGAGTAATTTTAAVGLAGGTGNVVGSAAAATATAGGGSASVDVAAELDALLCLRQPVSFVHVMVGAVTAADRVPLQTANRGGGGNARGPLPSSDRLRQPGSAAALVFNVDFIDCGCGPSLPQGLYRCVATPESADKQRQRPRAWRLWSAAEDAHLAAATAAEHSGLPTVLEAGRPVAQQQQPSVTLCGQAACLSARGHFICADPLGDHGGGGGGPSTGGVGSTVGFVSCLFVPSPALKEDAASLASVWCTPSEKNGGTLDAQRTAEYIVAKYEGAAANASEAAESLGSMLLAECWAALLSSNERFAAAARRLADTVRQNPPAPDAHRAAAQDSEEEEGEEAPVHSLEIYAASIAALAAASDGQQREFQETLTAMARAWRALYAALLREVDWQWGRQAGGSGEGGSVMQFLVLVRLGLQPHRDTNGGAGGEAAVSSTFSAAASCCAQVLAHLPSRGSPAGPAKSGSQRRREWWERRALMLYAHSRCGPDSPFVEITLEDLLSIAEAVGGSGDDGSTAEAEAAMAQHALLQALDVRAWFAACQRLAGQGLSLGDMEALCCRGWDARCVDAMPAAPMFRGLCSWVSAAVCLRRTQASAASGGGLLDLGRVTEAVERCLERWESQEEGGEDETAAACAVPAAQYDFIVSGVVSPQFCAERWPWCAVPPLAALAMWRTSLARWLRHYERYLTARPSLPPPAPAGDEEEEEPRWVRHTRAVRPRLLQILEACDAVSWLTCGDADAAAHLFRCVQESSERRLGGGTRRPQLDVTVWSVLPRLPEPRFFQEQQQQPSASADNAEALVRCLQQHLLEQHPASAAATGGGSGAGAVPDAAESAAVVGATLHHFFALSTGKALRRLAEATACDAAAWALPAHPAADGRPLLCRVWESLFVADPDALGNTVLAEKLLEAMAALQREQERRQRQTGPQLLISAAEVAMRLLRPLACLVYPTLLQWSVGSAVAAAAAAVTSSAPHIDGNKNTNSDNVVVAQWDGWGEAATSTLRAGEACARVQHTLVKILKLFEQDPVSQGGENEPAMAAAAAAAWAWACRCLRRLLLLVPPVDVQYQEALKSIRHANAGAGGGDVWNAGVAHVAGVVGLGDGGADESLPQLYLPAQTAYFVALCATPAAAAAAAGGPGSSSALSSGAEAPPLVRLLLAAEAVRRPLASFITQAWTRPGSVVGDGAGCVIDLASAASVGGQTRLKGRDFDVKEFLNACAEAAEGLTEALASGGAPELGAALLFLLLDTVREMMIDDSAGTALVAFPPQTQRSAHSLLSRVASRSYVEFSHGAEERRRLLFLLRPAFIPFLFEAAGRDSPQQLQRALRLVSGTGDDEEEEVDEEGNGSAYEQTAFHKLVVERVAPQNAHNRERFAAATAASPRVLRDFIAGVEAFMLGEAAPPPPREAAPAAPPPAPALEPEAVEDGWEEDSSSSNGDNGDNIRDAEKPEVSVSARSPSPPSTPPPAQQQQPQQQQQPSTPLSPHELQQRLGQLGKEEAFKRQQLLAAARAADDKFKSGPAFQRAVAALLLALRAERRRRELLSLAVAQKDLAQTMFERELQLRRRAGRQRLRETLIEIGERTRERLLTLNRAETEARRGVEAVWRAERAALEEHAARERRLVASEREERQLWRAAEAREREVLWDLCADELDAIAAREQHTHALAPPHPQRRAAEAPVSGWDDDDDGDNDGFSAVILPGRPHQQQQEKRAAVARPRRENPFSSEAAAEEQVAAEVSSGPTAKASAASNSSSGAAPAAEDNPLKHFGRVVEAGEGLLGAFGKISDRFHSTLLGAVAPPPPPHQVSKTAAGGAPPPPPPEPEPRAQGAEADEDDGWDWSDGDGEDNEEEEVGAGQGKNTVAMPVKRAAPINAVRVSPAQQPAAAAAAKLSSRPDRNVEVTLAADADDGGWGWSDGDEEDNNDGHGALTDVRAAAVPMAQPTTAAPVAEASVPSPAVVVPATIIPLARPTRTANDGEGDAGKRKKKKGLGGAVVAAGGVVAPTAGGGGEEEPQPPKPTTAALAPTPNPVRCISAEVEAAWEEDEERAKAAGGGDGASEGWGEVDSLEVAVPPPPNETAGGDNIPSHHNVQDSSAAAETEATATVSCTPTSPEAAAPGLEAGAVAALVAEVNARRRAELAAEALERGKLMRAFILA